MNRSFTLALLLRRIIFCLIILSSCLDHMSVYAQSPLPPEEVEIRMPLDQLQSSFSPDIGPPVKWYLWIIDKDTMARDFYDRSGNRTTHFYYKDNHPQTKSIYAYKDSLLLRSDEFMKDKLITTNTYTYNEYGNMTRWLGSSFEYNTKVNQTKEVKDRHWVIEWKDARHMKTRYSLLSGNEKTLQSVYHYNLSGQTTEIDEANWKRFFEYKDGLPVSKIKKSNDGAVIYNGTFTYDDQHRMTRSEDNYDIRTYGYDGDGMLKKMLVRKTTDTTWYQDADFYYKDGLLSSVDILFSDIRMLYAVAQFISKAPWEILWDMKKPNRMKMEFLYDDHRNITEIRYIVNEKYLYSKWFKYGYY